MVCGDEVGHLWSSFELIPLNGILENSISIRHALMLTKMFEPRLMPSLRAP
jgi:hypothetical protein